MPINTISFGAAVSSRRNELGLTQQDVAEAGGPSDTTQRKIEAGADVNVSVQTLKKYDAAFRWTEGTAASLLAGKYTSQLSPLGQAPRPSPPAPAVGQRKHHGAWELDHRILANLSLRGDDIEMYAASAHAVDEDDDVEDIVAAAHELADEVIEFISELNEVLEVGVGGRAHLRLLRSRIVSERQDRAKRSRVAQSLPQVDKAPHSTPDDQGPQADYELARRKGETEAEWRERTGHDYE